MQVLSLGQEYPLEKEMATHSSILVCRIPWTEDSVLWATAHCSLVGYSPWGHKGSEKTERLTLSFPSSILAWAIPRTEVPMDLGPWQATVHGSQKSRT